MSGTGRRARVFVQGIYAGELREVDEGYAFRYDEAYLSSPNSTSVSLTLPMTRTEYVSGVLFPFFDGLIPEGWLLDVVTRNWKIDPRDRFGILFVACKDPIGNVSIEEEPS